MFLYGQLLQNYIFHVLHIWYRIVLRPQEDVLVMVTLKAQKLAHLQRLKG